MLGPINAGKVGSTLVFDVRPRCRAAGRPDGRCASSGASTTSGPGAASSRRRSRVATAPGPATLVAAAPRERHRSRRAGTPRSRRSPPTGPTFSASSRSSRARLLDRTALLCAPLNPTRSGSRLVFTFRCSGRSGYGASPLDGPALLRAARRTRASPARRGCSASSPTPTTSTPRGRSGSWAARRCRGGTVERDRPRPYGETLTLPPGASGLPRSRAASRPTASPSRSRCRRTRRSSTSLTPAPSSTARRAWRTGRAR